MTALALVAALALTAGEDALPAAAIQESEVPGAEVRGAAAPAILSRFSLRIQVGKVLPFDGVDTRRRRGEPRSLGDDTALGAVAVGYRFHPNLELEVATGLSSVAGAESSVRSVAADYTEFALTRIPLTVGVRASIPAGGPWAGAGVGVYFSKVSLHTGFEDWAYSAVVNDTERVARFGGYAALGWDLAVARSLLLGFEFRVVKTSTSFERVAFDGDGLQLMAGVTYLFGVGGEAAPGAPRDGQAEPAKR